MNSKIRRLLVAGITMGTLAGTAGPALAHGHFSAGHVGTTTGTFQEVSPPKYRVDMLKFKAADESGWDGSWYSPVSDEPYWVVSSVTANGTQATRKSKTFGDVDSGESRNFSATDGCVFPTTCGSRSVTDGIGINIELMEEDNGNASEIVAKTAEYFRKAGGISQYTPAPSWVNKALGYMATAGDYISRWLKDDLLGTRTFSYSASSLQQRLPNAGMSFQESRYFGGLDSSGGADYYLTLKVTRVS